MKLFDFYLQPDFFMCCGAKYEPSQHFPMWGGIYLRSQFAYCILAFIYIKKRQRMLTSLQENTPDSSGLPRASGPHPSYHSLKSSGILVAMFVSVVVMHRALRVIAESDGMLDLPLAYALPFLQAGPPIVMSLGLPGVILVSNGKLSKAYKKNVTNFLNSSINFLSCKNSLHSLQQ